ncbi:MAG: outer membrane protein assembly factor BamA [Chlamydiae bacterium RIFCSPHIGHO2_12_FULL_49_11]|nr:MAG: outer membrane protein assembly factor BamA [Chlamydiae bacterium RIFCSPHIGHO2_12_FULL_49_11]
MNVHLFAYESFEGRNVGGIQIQVEKQVSGEKDTKFKILHEMQTKTGEPFDEEIFDVDLKNLSKQYDWVEPTLRVDDGKVYITLLVRPKPKIIRIEIAGNKQFTRKKLLGEAGLKLGQTLERDDLYESINKLRDFYIKHGYLKATVNTQLENDPTTNEVTLIIRISEGQKAFIQKIDLVNFTPKEKKEVLKLLHSSTYNPIAYWFTGAGVARDPIVESDQQVIINYIQNEGYADAYVEITFVPMPLDVPRPRKGLVMVITLHRGTLYHINSISFSGEKLKTTDELDRSIPLKTGDTFSIDKIRASQETIQDLYSQEGYLDTVVNYTLDVVPDKAEYNINFTIEESEKYRIGLIRVSGNYSTNKNVIYNNLDLTPGEVFDSRKLKSTQRRLQSTGLFQNVNVYTVKHEDMDHAGPEYRDVVVEVSESKTAHVNAFAGFNSTEKVFGGVELSENNFNIAGVKEMFTSGPAALRGGGQFLQIRGQIGSRDSGVNVSWLNPYFNDSLWRFSTDLNYNFNRTIPDYKVHTFGTALGLTYPLTPYFSYGYKFRVKDALISIQPGSPPPALDQALNSGVTSGVGLILNYDTTDSPFRAHRGMRSTFETEFAGLVRNDSRLSNFPFLRFLYNYHFYFPVTLKSTFKWKTELRFIQPLWVGSAQAMPLSEKFFLGGESNMRGFRPGFVGPEYGPDEPTGGISSTFMSFEYQYNLLKPIDLFGFFDLGSVTNKSWNVPKIYQSVGLGLRLNYGQRLPFVVGVGFPLNPDSSSQVQRLFFSMAGEF